MPNKEKEHIGTVLARAQLKFTTAPCSGYNPHYDSYYAMLKDFIDSCRTALNEEGVLVNFKLDFMPERTEGIIDKETGEVVSKTHYPRQDFLKLKLILGDQCLESICPIVVTDNMQTRKSAHTYAMRILLEGALCIASDEVDDDGSLAVGKTLMNDDSFKASKNKKTENKTNYKKPTPKSRDEAVEANADFLK